MAERNARAVGVDLGRVQAEVSGHGAGLGGEGFVGLDHVEVVDGEAGLLQRQLGGRHRADAHVLRVHAGVGVGHQARQRRQATRLGGGGFHQHHGGGGVVDARGVAGGDGAVLLHEHRLELGQFLHAAVGAEVLVGGVGHVTLAALEHDRDDLVLEAAFFGGALGAVVAFHGQPVLVFAADAPLGGDVLGGHAHVDGVEGVVQGADHHVHHLGVAHAGAPAHVEAGKRCAAHVFRTPADGHVGVAEQNALRGRDDGLQARAAQPVDVEGGRALGTTAVDGCHAREVHVLRLGVDDMAKHHVAHVLAVHAGAG
ncbi:hypothetical protein FQZ97_751640 [compost metagenome]